MSTQVKFGECLNLLISALDISCNKLSKTINVDSSLVNRWLHEQRIPAYHSNYIENIAEYLSENILNSFHEQRINEAVQSILENMDKEMNIKDKIKKALLESQGYSIESRKLEMADRKRSSQRTGQTSEILCSNQYDIQEKYSSFIDNTMQNTTADVPAINLSAEDKIIIGTKNILYTAVSLLETAANLKCKDNNTIYISFANDMDAIYANKDISARFQCALLATVKNGWNIVYLLRLNNNIDRTIKFIDFIEPLMTTNRFNVYYLKKYDVFITGKEMIIVPGLGALSCFPGKPNSQIDTGFFLKNKIAINVFMHYFNSIISTFAYPLIKYYTFDKNNEYSNFLIENEKKSGKRFFYKDELSTVALPENLFTKLLMRKRFSADLIQKELELYRERLNDFLSNLEHYEHLDIYSVDSIENLISHRLFLFCGINENTTIGLEVQDIIDYLQNMIYLLKKYEKYKIAFINERPNVNINNIRFYCMIKERHNALIHVFKPLSGFPEVRLSIEEPMVVQAFEEYFKKIWEQIAPVNKDKKEIIKWLENKIDLLKNKREPVKKSL